ncbi:phytosulfokine receptor 1 [Olea europaea subsp. europaea]|uniref:Phytosulfokine receptor 1 n=1 Tax=Olea europaea subsp. europaea TaxID=158383 RepID=A0A8S0VCA5_OLEEU|nr:phytosulfokine receptor 1 [Olea europaea subsp. europaea]
MLKFYLIVIFVGFFVQAVVLNSQNLTCNTNDLKTLEGLVSRLELGIEGWDFNSSSSNCCNWVEITCNSSSSRGVNDSFNFGRVVKLELGKKLLRGSIHESLGNLEQLKTLNLSHNFLKGFIPLSLLHLPKLEILDLAYNKIDGLFPNSINLPSIRVLNISENAIQGLVPVGICSNSTRISVLNLGFNNLSGNLPPGLGNCTSLEDLCLSSNLLSGGLPENLFRLPKLANLSLRKNRFSGQLSDLIELDLNPNDLKALEGFVSRLELGLLNWSSGKKMLRGSIHESLGNLEQLKTLNLSCNFLKGFIPLSLLHLPKLEILDLAYNEIDGLFPNSINLPSIKGLNISENAIQVPIPMGICSNSTRILVLNLGFTNLSGNLPPGIGN